MSRRRSPIVGYNCYHDHSQTESCKGHELVVVRSITSDTVSVEVDGEIEYVFDEGMFDAIIEADEKLESQAPAVPFET